MSTAVAWPVAVSTSMSAQSSPGAPLVDGWCGRVDLVLKQERKSSLKPAIVIEVEGSCDLGTQIWKASFSLVQWVVGRLDLLSTLLDS